jgi:hypothetical protein
MVVVQANAQHVCVAWRGGAESSRLGDRGGVRRRFRESIIAQRSCDLVPWPARLDVGRIKSGQWPLESKLSAIRIDPGPEDA